MRYILLLILASPVLASGVVTVGVNDFPPMVIVKGHDVSGLDIDIVREVCRNLDLTPRFVPVQDFGALMRDVARGKYDMAVSGISITAERERSIHFSQPYLDSGLNILVRAENPTLMRLQRAKMLITKIFSSVRWLLIFALIVAHVVWFLERGDDCFSTFYPRGILEAIYWAIVTMSTVGYGDFAPKHPVGRVCTTAIIVAGVGIFGFIIANITAITTNPGDFGALNSPEELHGKLVAAPDDTTSLSAITKYGAKPMATRTLAEAVRLLRTKKVDAVVFDTPAVLAEVKASNGDLEVAGEVFDRQRYGIALPPESKLTHRIDRALLEVTESDRFTYLKVKWLGKDGAM